MDTFICMDMDMGMGMGMGPVGASGPSVTCM